MARLRRAVGPECAQFDSHDIKWVNVDNGTMETLFEAKNGGNVVIATYNSRFNKAVLIHEPKFQTKE